MSSKFDAAHSAVSVLDAQYVALARACAQCTSIDALRVVFDHFVQPLLPHRGALLLVGLRRKDQLNLTHAVPLDYPEEATRSALAVNSVTERRALSDWLATGRPLVVDLPADDVDVSVVEAQEIERFGLGRIAAHGLLDPERQMGSYMTFCGVEASWDKLRVKERLQLITAPLHLALMQVLSTQKPLACAPATPALSATEQELIGWLSRGLTNAEIAHLRKRSAHTVRNQLSALFRKLGASNRTEALARARGLDE